MTFLKNNWFIIAIIVLFGGNITQFLNPIVKIKEIIHQDTVTTVKIDSVALTRAKAELKYLRSQIMTAKGKVIYKDVVSEIEIQDTTYIVPNFIASMDTTFKNSSIKLKYRYPQNEFYDIRFTYPQLNTEVTKTVEVKRLFNFSHGIQVGFGYGVINRNLDFFIGYGFTLGINYAR